MDPCTPIEGETILRAEGELGSFVGCSTDQIVHGTYRREGTWAPELLGLLTEDLLRQGGTLLDIGANIGLVAIPVTEKCPVRTIAFEPDPRNAELLRRNVGLHGLEQRVRIHPTALWSAPGTLQLRRDPRNHGDQRLIPVDAAEPSDLRVPLARFDALVNPTELRHPVVAKVDTQGAEVDVLQGIGAQLSRIDFAIIEVWPAGLRRMGRELQELVEAISKSFDFGKLLLEGEEIWPLPSIRKEFARLETVENLQDEDTFFDILVARQPGKSGPPAE